jgi:hypothetical protein
VPSNLVSIVVRSEVHDSQHPSKKPHLCSRTTLRCGSLQLHVGIVPFLFRYGLGYHIATLERLITFHTLLYELSKAMYRPKPAASCIHSLVVHMADAEVSLSVIPYLPL